MSKDHIPLAPPSNRSTLPLESRDASEGIIRGWHVRATCSRLDAGDPLRTSGAGHRLVEHRLRQDGFSHPREDATMPWLLPPMLVPVAGALALVFVWPRLRRPIPTRRLITETLVITAAMI